MRAVILSFPISRDPPEGGTYDGWLNLVNFALKFPISRDPPEGGTSRCGQQGGCFSKFPISRDPPEGGTFGGSGGGRTTRAVSNF